MNKINTLPTNVIKYFCIYFVYYTHQTVGYITNILEYI